MSFAPRACPRPLTSRPLWVGALCSAKNSRRYDPISPALAARLKEYYAPHNQELYRLLGKDLGWEA